MTKYNRLLALIPRSLRPNSFVLFLIALFLILIGDGILSYIFPIVLDNHVNSNFITGLIMSASSVVGIACDFLIPFLFSKYTWRFQLIVGIVLAITFPIATAIGDTYSIIWLFLIASLLWGIYFEFLMFAQQSFIVQEEKRTHYSHDWGIIEFLTDIVEAGAPILAAFLLLNGIFVYSSVTVFIEIIALVFALLLVIFNRTAPSKQSKSNIKEYINVAKELRYWKILSRKVITLLVMAAFVEIVFATFQTFAGLYGEQLINNPDWDWVVLVLATAPNMIGSFVISNLKLTHGKKRLSLIALSLSGVILSSLIFFQGHLVPILVIIFVSNMVLSVCWPLNDAIYSDLEDRLEKKRIHLIGLSQASYSIAYILAPSIMGFLADRVGYNSSFAILGGISAVVGIILLILTPKKLKLPQKELSQV